MLSQAFGYLMRTCWAGNHELGMEHDDADESMLWKWEPRDLRTLPKGYAAAGKSLKKRLGEVRCCDAAASALALLLCPPLIRSCVTYTGRPVC